jgi:predicted HicB family RNase H-like nuclease
MGGLETKRTNIAQTHIMKDEYDFSKAERGRFYRSEAVPIPCVHLDPEVLALLSARAEAEGVSLNELVNALLRKDIELIRAAE